MFDGGSVGVKEGDPGSKDEIKSFRKPQSVYPNIITIGNSGELKKNPPIPKLNIVY